MKKIIALILVLSLSLFAFAACGKKNKGETPDNNQGTTETPNNQTPAEKTYTLALAVDTAIGEDNKVSNYVTTLVLDEANKIVAVRIDCIETTVALEEGAIKNVASVTSKVEQGENYGGSTSYAPMTSGSFAKQTEAFENAIVGKTADEVANLDTTLVAGCTMPYSPSYFKAVIAKAFASTNKTTFKTSETFTLGLSATMEVKDGKVTSYYAGTAVVGGKIAANILDCNEVSFEIVEGAIQAKTYAGTKVEQGENYGGSTSYAPMTSGSFAKQTEAFENAIVGKTADEVANLDTTLVAGCTMPYSPYSFKAVVAKALANAR